MAVRSQHISLFAGAGGLDLSIQIAMPESRCVCYVEREIEAAEILAARIRDKALHDAPIWSDVCTFDGRPWRGRVDGIIGGFPCQDLSVAGKRGGIQRHNRSGLFYQYARIVGEVQPEWFYIENVPAVLAFPAGGIVLGELAAMGFDAEWGTLRASDVGAKHRRKRCWILAYKRGYRWRTSWPRHHGRDEWDVAYSGSERIAEDVAHSTGRGCTEERPGPGADVDDTSGPRFRKRQCSAGGEICDGTWRTQPCGRCDAVANSGCDAVRRCTECTEEIRRRPRSEVAGSGAELGNANDSGLEGWRQLAGGCTDERLAGTAGSGMVFAPGPADAIWNDVLVRDYGMRPALSQAEAESLVRGDADGLASPLHQRIDRLRACGNGVVPLQGAVALRELMRRINLI